MLFRLCFFFSFHDEVAKFIYNHLKSIFLGLQLKIRDHVGFCFFVNLILSQGFCLLIHFSNTYVNEMFGNSLFHCNITKILKEFIFLVDFIVSLILKLTVISLVLIIQTFWSLRCCGKKWDVCNWYLERGITCCKIKVVRQYCVPSLANYSGYGFTKRAEENVDGHSSDKLANINASVMHLSGKLVSINSSDICLINWLVSTVQSDICLVNWLVSTLQSGICLVNWLISTLQLPLLKLIFHKNCLLDLLCEMPSSIAVMFSSSIISCTNLLDVPLFLLLHTCPFTKWSSPEGEVE